MKISSEDVLEGGEKLAKHYNELGIHLVAAKSYEKAVECYELAQEFVDSPRIKAQLFFNLGLCYMKWEKNELATQCFDLASIKAPNYSRAKEYSAMLQN